MQLLSDHTILLHTLVGNASGIDSHQIEFGLREITTGIYILRPAVRLHNLLALLSYLTVLLEEKTCRSLLFHTLLTRRETTLGTPREFKR